MTANNAGKISNLESQVDTEFNRRCLVMKAEHVEQITRAELKRPGTQLCFWNSKPQPLTLLPRLAEPLLQRSKGAR
eukprot:5127791-Heterocapsa_arctica.AAC.1